MNKKQLISDIFKTGSAAGMTEMEVYISEGEVFEVKVSKQEIDGYKLAATSGLGFRGFYNGKIGYSYTEKISDDSIEFLIKGAVENAEINDSEDNDVIFEGSEKYTSVDNVNPDLEKVTEKQKIDFTMALEKKALALDTRIKASQYCMMGSGAGTSVLSNTKGLDLTDSGNYAYAILMVLAAEGDVYSSGFDFLIDNDFSKFDADKMAKTAVDMALDFLDAKPVKSGDYKIILDGMVSADLLSSVSSIFSARAVQKNLSLLRGKLNEKVASECVTLVDDPFLKGGTGTASFDGEGVATKYKNVIENGILKTYLHNLKSSGHDNVESTGNASRGSYKSTIGISATNFYIKSGEKSVDELISEMENGIHIVELEGMHSGFNPISGDFSLPAKGYLIENGKKVHAINQITVSGNYYDALKNISNVASDLKFAMGGGTGSPSLVIEKLAVAGE
ncbi:MAG: TldD/PmbA family protein [Clostridiales bacterium]|nr:TldD/PmbA family protein [Clostridiales bacterium]